MTNRISMGTRVTYNIARFKDGKGHGRPAWAPSYPQRDFTLLEDAQEHIRKNAHQHDAPLCRVVERREEWFRHEPS